MPNASKINEPSPGQSKIFSVMTAPVIKTPNWRLKRVMIGIAAFLSMCFVIISNLLTPFALAVLIKSEFMISIIAFRVIRLSPAARAEPRVIAGKT